LLGKTCSEGGDDPWPVILPGEEKPVSSARIGEYITDELLYYYNFYLTTKKCGNPLASGWTNWPPWMHQLVLRFDNVVDEVCYYNQRMSYKQAGVM